MKQNRRGPGGSPPEDREYEGIMRAFARSKGMESQLKGDLELWRNWLFREKPHPFGRGDGTVGMEFELQVAVEGSAEMVDLPLTIHGSNFYRNMVKRIGRGDLESEAASALEEYLTEQSLAPIWENSWVRLPEQELSPTLQKVFEEDLRADRQDTGSKPRSDADRFRCLHQGEECLRIPVSYLLKLSLVSLISDSGAGSPELRHTGNTLLDHFISDNTSPEILSLNVVGQDHGSLGSQAAAEAARTFLFSQLLVQYGNRGLGLERLGQKCHLYFAPQAPVRQKKLNEAVPDGFYRHLFMSPCLSGWRHGEEKYRYMGICHRTLSRSQLNTISKLRDAGILTNNLAVLPNTSSTCLANNGTHVSIGSRVLGEMAGNGQSGYSPFTEKHFGDLVIKVVEHFLPLFVGTCSAAPSRLDFCEFHPEKVLGFLPHELDYTHLRMLWRRWKKKARNRVFGKDLTPFGPRWLDSGLSRILGLRGDLVPDFRLVDYLVSLLSTESSSAFNGVLGNHEQLVEELGKLGIFDSRMSIYVPYRQRIFAQHGYSGFEGRFYSLFPSLLSDLKDGVDLQHLVTGLACQMVQEGMVHHTDIPDRPAIESERRQVLFCCALGIPTFYVRQNSTNSFLMSIIRTIPSCRKSSRYRNYIRVVTADYQMALLDYIKDAGAGFVEELGLEDLLVRLGQDIGQSGTGAADRLIRGGLGERGARSVFSYSSDEFGREMESYYRGRLKQNHMDEGLDVLLQDCRRQEVSSSPVLKKLMETLSPGMSAEQYVQRYREEILAETADIDVIRGVGLISLAIIQIIRESWI